MSAQVQTTRAQQTDAQNNPHSADKLIGSEDIMKGFEEGEAKVKVIVNLAEPLQVLATVDWKSKSSLNRLQDEILTRQLKVLSGLDDVEFTLRRRFENQAGFSGEVTPEGLDRLLNDPRVKSIEPVYVLDLHLGQGIPLINALEYRSTYNGQGVAIAICDTGIDTTHPRLSGKVIGGYDFGNDDSNPTPDSHSCEDYFDAASHAHGTSCAGIAAGALGTVGDYIGGVAHNAKLYSLKVIDNDCIMYNDYVIAAWNWCVSHKNDNPDYPILAISNSVGGGQFFNSCDSVHTAFATAANNAVAAGITVLASSGNDGYCDSIESPACVSNIISVGAVYDAAFGEYCWCVDKESCANQNTIVCPTSCKDGDGFYTVQATGADVVTAYSNTASFLDVFAPSHNAYTTDIRGSGGFDPGDYVPNFGGTSAACPYAAGAVACMQSASKACRGRYLSPSEVRSILTSTGDNRTDGKVPITKPRINLGKAIDEPLICGVCTDVTSPTSSSIWECDRTYTISWNPLPNTSLVDIWLTNGSDWWPIADDISDTGSYSWNVPTCLEDGCNYQVEVRSSSEPDCKGTSDTFCITCCIIVVTSPTGGSSWECENCYDIKWISKCNPSDYVEIHLYKDDLPERTITASAADNGSYHWCVTEDITPGLDYQIEVRSSSNPSCNGMSGYFSIICPCVITVTEPLPGSWREVGEDLPINWDYEHYSGDFKIELYKGGSLDRLIDPGTGDNESYLWPIPTDGSLIGGDDYQIKVTAVLNPLCSHDSNEFGIAAPPQAQDSTVPTEVDTPVRITLQAADEGYPEALTYIITSLPIHGNLSDPYAGPITDSCMPLANNGNQVDYFPDTDYLGQDSFTFKVHDGGVWPGGGYSETATVWIKIGVFYVVGMDNDAGWSASGEWQWGRPAGQGGSSHGNPDPAGGYTGSKVYGMNINGDYYTGIGGPYYLTTQAIDCSEYTNVHLRFYRWLNCDYEPYVHETLEVSNDGSIWTVVWENDGPPHIADGSWQLVEYDISSLADSQPAVYFRWGHRVASGSAYAYSGWNIDDLEVVGKRRYVLVGDFDLDERVDFYDFDTLARQWLQPPGVPSADIAPETPDGFVDTLDLAVFAENWLEGF